MTYKYNQTDILDWQNKVLDVERFKKMKLLQRLRELRNELHPEWMIEQIDAKENQHIETIGIGATTVDDIARLNIAQRNFENLDADDTHHQY